MRFIAGILLVVVGFAFSGTTVEMSRPLLAWMFALMFIPGGALIGLGLADFGGPG